MVNTTVYPYGTGGSLPSSIGIINDMTTGGADKALSAEQGVVIGNDLNPLKKQVLGESEFSPVWEINGKYIEPQYGTPLNGTGWSISSEFSLKKGDYVKVTTEGVGAVIVAVINGNRYTPLVSAPQNATGLNSYYYAAPEDKQVVVSAKIGQGNVTISNGFFTNFPLEWTIKGQYVKTDGTLASLIGWAISEPFTLTSGKSITIFTEGSAFCPIASFDGTTYTPLVNASNNATGCNSYTYTAASDIQIIVSGKIGQGNVFVGESLVGIRDALSRKGDSVTTQEPGFNSSIQFVDSDGLVATAWNYMLKDVSIEGVQTLMFSKDLGKTWTSAANTYGPIVYVHFFTNGAVLFSTYTKCYYFTDITDIHESTLLDENGEQYVSSATEDFFCITGQNYPSIVGDVEVVAWGTYSLNDAGYVARVWYSPNFGATVKCCLKFGTTPVGGETVGARHVHFTAYHAPDETFIIGTGDTGNECQLIRGTYAPQNDSWSFEMLGKGAAYKFGNVYFANGFCYFTSDYTNTSDGPRGIYRVPYSRITELTAFQCISSVDFNRGVLHFLVDSHGNKILTPDGDGRGWLWYCRDDFNFVQVSFSESAALGGIGDPNYNGQILARKSSGAASFPFSLTGYMIDLTASLRNAGLTDFFKQDNVFFRPKLA